MITLNLPGPSAKDLIDRLPVQKAPSPAASRGFRWQRFPFYFGAVAIVVSVAGEAFRFVTAVSEVLYQPTCTLISPLVLDLDGAGVRTLPRLVGYDMNGDGVAEQVNALSWGNGVLAFDADGDGLAGENGLELFGDRTDLDGDGRSDGYRDGFEALRALAARGGLAGLRVRRGGVDGQVQTLAEAGVASLEIAQGAATYQKNFDGRGNDIQRAPDATFTRTDGSKGVYEDVWFRIERNGPGGAI